MTKWIDRIWAAGMFFTRLPLWRIRQVPPEAFKQIVPCWSLVGWLTGGVMAGVYLLSEQYFSLDVAVILSLLARLLLTGALHEDGLADFLDGMGGGRDKAGVLRIMKDSHIGTYGVLSLIAYYLLGYAVLKNLPPYLTPWVLWSADAWSKALAAQLINVLPYARLEVESKAQVVYTRMRWTEFVFVASWGILPLVCSPFPLWVAVCPPPASLVGLGLDDETTHSGLYGRLLRGYLPAVRTHLLAGCHRPIYLILEDT